MAATVGPITVRMRTKGSFDKTFTFLKRMREKKFLEKLDMYAQKGVEALRAATPKDTGKTAASWDYEITDDGNVLTVTWINTNVVNDWYNVALMIQYGHGTGTGGYVEGIDYINPALRPVFEEMAGKIWEEVNKS